MFSNKRPVSVEDNLGDNLFLKRMRTSEFNNEQKHVLMGTPLQGRDKTKLAISRTTEAQKEDNQSYKFDFGVYNKAASNGFRHGRRNQCTAEARKRDVKQSRKLTEPHKSYHPETCPVICEALQAELAQIEEEATETSSERGEEEILVCPPAPRLRPQRLTAPAMSSEEILQSYLTQLRAFADYIQTMQDQTKSSSSRS